MTDRTWAAEWITARCEACGEGGHWPQPELDCPCGAVLRVPVAGAESGAEAGAGTEVGIEVAPGERLGGTEAAPGERPGGAETAPGSGEVPTPPPGERPGGTETAPGERPGGTETTAGERPGGAETAPGSGEVPTPPPGERPGGTETAPGERPGGTETTPGERPGGAETAPGSGEAPTPPPGHPHPSHPSHIPLPRTAPRPRPAFRPVTIRDARDAVTVAALYLRWLGYLNTRSAARRPPSGSRIAARGMLAQVEPALRPTTLRDIECLWLTAMTEAVDTPVACAFFSLAGYTSGARTRADSLGVPLFTMDATGTPQPVNGAADELVATGA
ncbi:hypothetical protein [Streptomyces sp. Je 1-369]|uniref:hypothetical protein n=1 Tax=Streptomyces sp. Je 1-369 TaxID=2966192 RepID=UPI002AA29C7E|nr:hypothetical protein [Streptomyces sp. Je 1-369]